MKLNKIFIAFCLITLSSEKKSFTNELAKFVKVSFNNFQTVGAIAPLSSFTANTISNKIHKNIHKKKNNKTVNLLEIGAGTGNLSSHFVSMLDKNEINYNLDLVEIDKEFCKILHEKFNTNPNVNVFVQDICKFQTKKKYDFIVSTLPFNNKIFPPKTMETILSKYEKLINKNGRLFWVEYAIMGNISKLFLSKKEKKEYNLKQEILEKFRKKHNLKIDFVFANIPPTYVYSLKFNK